MQSSRAVPTGVGTAFFYFWTWVNGSRVYSVWLFNTFFISFLYLCAVLE